MIRKAKESDLNKIYILCEQYDKNYSKLNNLEDEINNSYSILLVDEIDNNIISFLYAQDFKDNYDILFFIVDKSYQNKGYGTKLLKFFVDNYIINNQTVTLEVSVENEYAIKLYEKFNFKRINIRKGYYNGIDAIVLRRE